MPTTQIAASTIAAQAFRFMELAPISSFEDDSERAEAARQQYPIALKMCLEECDWSFASTFTQLSQAALIAPMIADEALPYAFAVPSDCVTVQEVQPSSVRWRIDGIMIRADRPGVLTIRYTSLIDNEARLPATFQVAVSLALAILLAPRWMSVRTKIADLGSSYDKAIAKAKDWDANSASGARYDGRQGYWSDDWVSGAIL